jgi:hypothetical protein
LAKNKINLLITVRGFFIVKNKIKCFLRFFLYLVVKCLDMKKILLKYIKPITYIVITTITILLWGEVVKYILSQIK